MAEPFADFVIPPLIHTAGLLVGAGFVIALLFAAKPSVNQKTVLAFAPWIVVGAVLHVFYQLGVTLKQPLYPDPIEPLFSAPAVYITVFIVMGLIWAVATMFMTNPDADYVSQYLSGIGVGTMVPLIGLLLWRGTDPAVRPMEPVFPAAGLLLAVGATFLITLALGLWRTGLIAKVRYVGPLVLFAHLFDGITTAIGVDLLGATERSAIPQAILDLSAGLPTASIIGTGWLFVLVKLVVAVAIVVLFADYVNEEPLEANLLMSVIIAVGLGPGTYNFFLFILSP
jgi:uncharacterized membrane protein